MKVIISYFSKITPALGHANTIAFCDKDDILVLLRNKSLNLPDR